MKLNDEKLELAVLHDKSNYQISDLDSEISADRYCSALLKKFHQHLLQERKLDPLEAGSQAGGVDYFLREFMIGKLRRNIFSATAEQVRQFAGNWYIISNLEPNMSELETMLAGTASFYQYCAANQLTSGEVAEEIAATCRETGYFQQRIDDFHAISGDGYTAWENVCPL